MAKIKNILLKRPLNSNKSDYGHIFVIAGSLGMSGAAYLTAQSALLSGSGLVTLGTPRSLNTILSRKFIEVMTRPLPETKNGSLSIKAFSEVEKFIKTKKVNVLAVGPGLSQNKQTCALARKIISKIDLPMVIDADGLNALVGHLNLLQDRRSKLRNIVITPHPGEMARLLGETVSEIQKNRKNIAKRIASKYNITVVLKGHGTVVADSSGHCYINETGNPGMATAGCGDVLTGIIASFMGQGMDVFRSAKAGAYVHGLAGDMAEKEVGQVSLTATALLNKIPGAIRSLATK